MSKNRKRATTLAAAGAVAAVAIGGGVAWAAFTRNSTAETKGNAATFQQLGVEGKLAAGSGENMLPGEKMAIVITVKTPGGNTVNGKVVEIKPKAITASSIVGIDAAAKADCATWLSAKTFSDPGVVISATAGNTDITLSDAVTFSADATEKCSGMRFTTEWDVKFEATKSNPSGTPVTL